ncbi:MAG: HIT family protein [Simkania sp.]|nr:HIT family protein [Simkania sp.]
MLSGKIAWVEKALEAFAFTRGSCHNIRPFVRGAHFLITPAYHCTHFTDVPSDVILDMLETAKKIIKTMATRFGRKDVKMYLQQGFNAGQTVFHPHLHVLLTPDPIRHLLFSLDYKNWPRETNQQFEEIRKVMVPLLVDSQM